MAEEEGLVEFSTAEGFWASSIRLPRSPFHEKLLFFCIITRLANRRDIAFGGSSTTGQRHNMVHCQFTGGRGLAAVSADALGALTFPPLRRAQLPGFPAFPLNILVFQIPGKSFHHNF